MLEGMRTLRGSLSAVILLGALVPSLLIASYLIERFRSASEASTMAALEKNATLLTLDVKRDYELLLAAAEQLSSDPDVIYSAYTGAFGAKANIKLARFTQLHPSVFGAMVVDSLAWPVEATPTTLGLLDMAPMTPLLTDFFNDSKQAKIQINDIENASLLSDIYNIQHKDVEDVKELRSDHLFMVMSPLWLSAVDKAELHELVGAMVVLLPVHTLIEEAQKRLLHGDGLDIVILDLMMDNQSLIRPESKLAEVNDYIVIDVPMRVSQSTDTIVWTLGVERAAALQTIDDLQLELWLIVVGLILVLSVVAFWLARYVVNPINSVNKLVASYAGADYSKRSLKLPFRELQQMANVLEQMAQRIVEDQHKLEQRVLNRTYELQNANNELNHTMHQLKATQAQLVEVEKMSLLGQLVAGIAHEINTPVGVAVTAATMLEQQVIELDQRIKDSKLTRTDLNDYVESTLQTGEMVITNLHRAANLIRNFKEVAADQNDEQKRVFTLYGYIESLLRSLEGELKSFKISVDLSGDKTVQLNSYPSAYSQIITNFIINSLKHGFKRQHQHHISIAFEIHGDTLLLRYKDDGRGIDANTLPKIFDPFFTTQRTAGGTGLGLHIVYNIVNQRLGGTIDASSEVGAGVEFTIRVPLIPPTKAPSRA